MTVTTRLKGHFEMLPARDYYGRHATGTVLHNGTPVHHGSRAEAVRLIKNAEVLVYGNTP
jgi:hypothetical protein